MTGVSIVIAVMSGVAMAAIPETAMSASGSGDGRALSASADFWKVAVVTTISLCGLFLVAGMGYLYMRERGLAWEFQRPDSDDDHGESGH